jgi:hypothetical protein
LALRVDEAAYRSDRIGGVDRGEIAIALEKPVKRPRDNVESSCELARRVDTVDDSTTIRARPVNRGEDAFVQHEAMRVPSCIIIVSYDLVRAIPDGFSSGRPGHVNRVKAVLGLRQSRDTQKQAKGNSRK